MTARQSRRARACLAASLLAIGAPAIRPAVGQVRLTWAERDLATVSREAKRGDKAAQLELGRRYEEGRGVTASLPTAERWYRKAAKTDVKRRLLYSAPVGSERFGRAEEAGPPTITPGLPEAARRLHALRRKVR